MLSSIWVSEKGNEKSQNAYVVFVVFLRLIDLFLVVLGLHSCRQTFSSCSERSAALH